MHDPDRPADQIEQIHAMMTRSTTFVSLSGLSGVAAGLVAFGAVWQIHRLLHTLWLTDNVFTMLRDAPDKVLALAGIFLWTLIGALALAFLFTWRRSRRNHLGLWNIASRRFAMHLALPLIAGGAFIVALGLRGSYEMICPAMLIFFGLALLNAGKYSFTEIVVLGTTELALGLVAAFWPEGGLLLWGAGFGIATAGYGILMYLKHE